MHEDRYQVACIHLLSPLLGEQPGEVLSAKHLNPVFVTGAGENHSLPAVVVVEDAIDGVFRCVRTERHPTGTSRVVLSLAR